MYLNENDLSFAYSTAELAFVYIKRLKTWYNQCVSLHPNIDCAVAESNDEECPCVKVFEKKELDLFQRENLNVKVFVGENGTGKTTLLNALRRGTEGVAVVLRDSLGRYISSNKISLKVYRNEQDVCDVKLTHPMGGPIEHLSECSMLTPLADRDSKNIIREEPFFFGIRFFQVYQKNPSLYQFEKDNELMPFFYIKPRPTIISNIKFYIEEFCGKIFNDALFEEEFCKDPVGFIMLFQFLEEKEFWSDLETENTIIYPADILSFFKQKFELLRLSCDQDVCNKINEITQSIKCILIDEHGEFKCYNTSDFDNVKLNLEENLQLLIEPFQTIIHRSFNMDLFYYHGFAIIDGEKRYLSDLSDGEISSLKQRYIWYAALTQISECSGYYLTMDEPDESLHPEWKRLFWKNFIDNFKFVKEYVMQEFQVLADCKPDKRESYLEKKEIVATRRFGLILSTHSPFLLSDLFDHNVVYLDKEKKNNLWHTITKKSAKTFAGNIGEMFYSSFFMDSTIGAVAEEYVKRILNIRKGLNPDNPDEMLTEEQLQEYKHEADAICQNIGDPVIKCLLE